MEACVEASALLAGNPAACWAIRIARPVGDGFRIAHELLGVPRPALQAVFGHALGRRIWEQGRVQAAAGVLRPVNQIADAEIAARMVEYVSRQAADTLRGRGRQAKAIRLTVAYADRESRQVRTRLARPTDEGDEIAECAGALLRRLPVHGALSVDLRVTSVEVVTTQERANGLGYSLAGSSAGA
jgi:hypothetical protein